MYEFRGMYISDHMMEGIMRYIDHGINPGDFLTAVICNDLKGACGWMEEKKTNRSLTGYTLEEGGKT